MHFQVTLRVESKSDHTRESAIRLGEEPTILTVGGELSSLWDSF